MTNEKVEWLLIGGAEHRKKITTNSWKEIIRFNTDRLTHASLTEQDNAPKPIKELIYQRCTYTIDRKVFYIGAVNQQEIQAIPEKEMRSLIKNADLKPFRTR